MDRNIYVADALSVVLVQIAYEQEEILGIACEVLPDKTQLPGIVLEVRPQRARHQCEAMSGS